MEAKELRIGNLINHFGLDTIFEVTPTEINCAVEMEGHFSMTFEGIPITEEWLLKFGFVHHHDTPHPNRVFRKNYVEGFFDLEEVISFFYGGNFTSVELKYVHQLQNLYFSLTGEELTIKK